MLWLKHAISLKFFSSGEKKCVLAKLLIFSVFPGANYFLILFGQCKSPFLHKSNFGIEFRPQIGGYNFKGSLLLRQIKIRGCNLDLILILFNSRFV